MGRLYARFALLLQAFVIVSGTVFFIAAHPVTARLVLQKALKPAGVSFENVKGSLIYGFSLYDLRYKKAVQIERLDATYSLAELISPAPSVRSIGITGLAVYPDRFEAEPKKRESKKSGVAFVPVTIRYVSVDKGSIRLSPAVTFKASMKEIVLAQEDITAKALLADIDSAYGSARLNGRLAKRTIHAQGTVSPASRYMDRVGQYVDTAVRTLPVRLVLDEKRLRLSTGLKSPLKFRDTNLSVSGVSVSAEYLLKETYVKASALYDIETPFIRTHIEQSAIVTLFGAYATKIEGNISKSAHRLPFKRFRTDAAGDPGVFMADTYAGPFLVSLYSKDYENFAVEAVAKPHRLNYIEHLPRIFSNQQISMEANATARLKPKPSVAGVVSLDGNYSAAKSYFELTEKSLLVRSKVTPKKRSGGIWENVPDTLKSKIVTFVYLTKERKIFNLIAKKANLTLFEQQGSISGWANIGSLLLDADGSLLDDGTVNLAFDAQIDSLHALLSDFNITTDPMIDAQIESRFDLSIGDTFSLRYRTQIPWYLVEPDSQHIYYGLDSVLEGSLKGNRATIDRYSVGFKNRRFSQKRPSIISLDDRLTLHIERFCLLDTPVLTGTFDFKKRQGAFLLTGKDAHYDAPEGNFTFDADINASVSPEKISVEGEIEITDALVTYRPAKEYVVEDEDIVIIQDIKEPSHTKRGLDIHIYSKKPLRYKIPELSASFIPDITLWKEPGKPFGILGIVKILSGEIDAADKHFVIQPSEIYFGGANPINPYLDLHILYELDFYRFNIYISHTLAKPLFLFSSEPPMSQNDIMSYILFGAPAGEAFASSGESGSSIATMLLGMGLKNAIGSATGIRFDTLNILSNENGGFGIEIGKRIGKRLRIIYRNDTVSSFIIQYKASRSIRIDVDVKDTGQGINILYIKDFGKIKTSKNSGSHTPSGKMP